MKNKSAKPSLRAISFGEIVERISKYQYYPKPGVAQLDFALYRSDCIELMRAIPDNSIDLIFADPPYFLSNGGITCHAGKMVSVNKGKWDVSKGAEANHEFNKAWLRECQRILTKDGTIWVSGTAHIIHSVGFAMQQLGFKLLNDIIWYKINPPPNLSCRYFTHSTETITWAAKSSKSKHIFNYSEMKAVTGKQMKNVWQDLFWEITPPKAGEKKFGKHPTQKPVKLLERIIKSSSREGQIVLDPFNGHGTTGIVAHRLHRKYIGVDIERGYLNITVKRIEEALSKKDTVFGKR
ncbi:MAG: site-specific DNA-methyltransferase [Candidatus Omnitrophota bacterium]